MDDQGRDKEKRRQLSSLWSREKEEAEKRKGGAARRWGTGVVWPGGGRVKPKKKAFYSHSRMLQLLFGWECSQRARRKAKPIAQITQSTAQRRSRLAEWWETPSGAPTSQLRALRSSPNPWMKPPHAGTASTEGPHSRAWSPFCTITLFLQLFIFFMKLIKTIKFKIKNNYCFTILLVHLNTYTLILWKELSVMKGEKLNIISLYMKVVFTTISPKQIWLIPLTEQIYACLLKGKPICVLGGVLQEKFIGLQGLHPILTLYHGPVAGWCKHAVRCICEHSTSAGRSTNIQWPAVHLDC